MISQTPDIAFDEASHIYRWKGEIVPSNTGVLKASGHGVNPYYTDDGREVGKAVHLACQYYDEGRLEFSSLETPLGADERTAKLKAKVRGRVAAYIRFREETGFEPDLIEFITFSPELRVAGTLDRTGTFPDNRSRMTLLDLKGGAEAKWHGYQTAGYALMEFPCSYGHLDPMVQRAALYLGDNGKYKFRIHRMATDFDEFRTAVAEYYRQARR